MLVKMLSTTITLDSDKTEKKQRILKLSIFKDGSYIFLLILILYLYNPWWWEMLLLRVTVVQEIILTAIIFISKIFI